MKEVIPFNFEAQQIRVVKDEQGEPWFVAKDVLAVLQLNSMAFHRIDDNEKGVSSIYTPGGNQAVRTVSESGLYKLIMRSRKPQAKPFQNWVTQVVLPSIRKTGGYIAGEEHMDEDELVLKAMQVLQRKLEEKQKLIEEQKPKVEAFDQLMDSNGTFSLEGLAKILGMSVIKFTRKLREDGYLAKDRDRKGNFSNLPNQKYVDKGFFKVFPVTYVYYDKQLDERVVGSALQTRVLPPALDYFRKVYSSETKRSA